MTNETLETLKNRRSIRKYKPEQVSDEALNAVLEAGTYAATAAGTQAPVIVAVQDPETVAQLNRMNADVLRQQMPGNAMSTPYYGAPTIILVLVPEDGHAPDIDGALVGGNIMNAAYSVGLGTCWIHRSEPMFASEEGKALLAKWGLPSNLKGVGSIALGYPDCPHPQAAPRKADYIVRV